MEINNLGYEDIIKNINYTFTPDKIYGVVGNKENSTLFLELIRGLKKSTVGTINKQNLKIFMLFEESENQIFNETIREEILGDLDETNIDLLDICEKLNITEELWEKNPLNLSVGEKRKIVIASMLAFNPDVILVDNFLNCLDYENQKRFIDILKRLQFDDHKIVIIADQNINLLYEIVDEVLVLTDEILLSGNKYNVFKNSDLLRDLGIEVPKYIDFCDIVKSKKNIDLIYRDRITDIAKDVYDNV